MFGIFFPTMLYSSYNHTRNLCFMVPICAFGIYMHLHRKDLFFDSLTYCWFQLLEKLFKERWNPEDGVGSIIISPTRELASQTFDVLKAVGRHHNFSAGLLIGGRKDVEAEKERVNELNILVCTPGRLLQHMDETPNFECSQLQVYFFLLLSCLLLRGEWHICGHTRWKIRLQKSV